MHRRNRRRPLIEATSKTLIFYKSTSMKYTCEITINKPLADVIKLFDDPENMKEWQPGLQSYEFLEGPPGQAGSTMKLKYAMGKRQIEMVETILENSLPEKFSGTYEAQGVYNKMDISFVAIDDNTTKWISDQEFRMSGFMKVWAFLMPGSFKKQSMVFLEKFKEFAERT